MVACNKKKKQNKNKKAAKLTHFRGTFGLTWVDDTSPALPGGFFSSSSSNISSKTCISMLPLAAVPKCASTLKSKKQKGTMKLQVMWLT